MQNDTIASPCRALTEQVERVTRQIRDVLNSPGVQAVREMHERLAAIRVVIPALPFVRLPSIGDP